MPRLINKTAVVTGAGSGIGRAIAERLAAEGAHVFAVELSAERAADTLAAIAGAGGECTVLPADVSDTDAMRAAFAAVPKLDILVNNAGIAHIGNVLGTLVTTFMLVPEFGSRALTMIFAGVTIACGVVMMLADRFLRGAER